MTHVTWGRQGHSRLPHVFWAASLGALLIFLLLFVGSTSSPLWADAPIVISSPTVENTFPEHLQVSWSIESRDGAVVAVKGKLQVGRDKSLQRIEPVFTPGTHVVARWTWDTHKITIAPYIPITLWITAQDATGNRAEGGPFHVVYDDNRFDWREHRSERLVLRWYAGNESFGAHLFALGDKALQRQLSDFDVRLRTPLVFLIYASQEDFFAWHSINTEWVGGQAFPELGVAAAVIPPNGDEYWVRSVIPHELLHLVMGQVVTNPFGRPPAWFEEGMAQYYEEVDHELDRRVLDEAVKQGTLLPLGVMRDPPGQDPETAYRWYAQALSMVEWLLQSRGKEALRTYMALMQKPYPPSKAFVDAFGISEEDFYASWREHVGLPLPPTPTPSPSPTSTPTTQPTPTGTPTSRTLALSPVPTRGITTTPMPTEMQPLLTPTRAAEREAKTGAAGRSPWVPALLLAFLVILGIIIGLAIRHRYRTF